MGLVFGDRRISSSGGYFAEGSCNGAEPNAWIEEIDLACFLAAPVVAHERVYKPAAIAVVALLERREVLHHIGIEEDVSFKSRFHNDLTRTGLCAPIILPTGAAVKRFLGITVS